MMMARGHEVFLYAGKENEAPCTEFISCMSKAEIEPIIKAAGHYTSAPFDHNLPHWRHFNHRAANAIRARLNDKDFVCVIGGYSNKPLADALPGAMVVEFGIGYPGTFAPYRVFESYAWMHTTYARMAGMGNITGNSYDDVIPGFVDMTKHPFVEKPREDYCLFVGRITELKGYAVAADACRAAGVPLKLAGPGTPRSLLGDVTYLGVIGEEERGRLMSRARAVFVPSLYVEPFGMVHVEAMASGTPVITTDWGVFPETVINGFNGYRCRMLREFVEAVELVRYLDPAAIRQHTADRFSMEVIGPRYERYFERLLTVWGRGWYEGVTDPITAARAATTSPVAA